MISKKNLLSIGDVSKLTGAGIKSLRYYEKINILKPAYVSPDSGYRYYTLEQTNVVEIIMFCVALDIPLKELAKFSDEDGVMDFKSFFSEKRKVVEKKLNGLKKGLNLIDFIERQIDLAELHQTGQIYTRKIPEKSFYVKPCGKTLKGLDQVKIIAAFWKDFWEAQYYHDEDGIEFPEYGILGECSPEGTMYYAFIEAQVPVPSENVMTLPAGTYFCRLDEDSLLENAHELFSEQLAGRESFFAIETGIFTGKHNFSKPVNELRIIARERD